MTNVKLVVMYPRPKDIDAFEKVYQNEHVPLAVAVLGGKTKIVGTKVLGSPQGTPAFYRIAEMNVICHANSRTPLFGKGTLPSDPGA